MVIWIIGLSGSGKSHYAKILHKKLKHSIIVDGDEVRKYMTFKLGYKLSDRKQNSEIISNLCNFLEKQGLIVICPILSIFTQHQKENRKKFTNYYQIYIKSDLKNLIKRNSKNIYENKKNVVGCDIKFPKPHKSDLTILNTYTKKNTIDNLKKIFQLLKYDISRKVN